MDLYITIGNNKGIRKYYTIKEYEGTLKIANEEIGTLLNLKIEGSAIRFNEDGNKKHKTVKTIKEAYQLFSN